jgi:uncharacterized membrane protein YfcA
MDPVGIFFKFSVLLAGFVDSIVGGGGLITLPVFTFLVGPGPQAIGTNKIVGIVAALTALIIYTKNGHLKLKIASAFFISVGIGTVIGSRLALILPPEVFKYLMMIACPILLYIILNKKHFIHEQSDVGHSNHPIYKLIFSGVLCGIYDGVLGPGAGTLMLLSLVLFARLPLMVAIACSKFANFISAATALTSFALSGVVSWSIGLHLAAFSFLGAVIGANLANKKAEKVARPLLALVVIGLMIKLALE